MNGAEDAQFRGLTELRRLAEAATPGPWEFCADQSVMALPAPSSDVIECAIYECRTIIDWTPRTTDAEFIAAANPAVILDLLDAAEALERVRALHRPYSIYGECDCPEEKDESTHVEVEEVGRTCNKLAVVCFECCTAGSGYQSEECAYAHTHALVGPYCNTLRTIDGEVRS